MIDGPDPVRDCPHGHQLGKCDTCQLIVLETVISDLLAALESAPEPIGDPSDIKFYKWWHRERAAAIAKIRVKP